MQYKLASYLQVMQCKLASHHLRVVMHANLGHFQGPSSSCQGNGYRQFTVLFIFILSKWLITNSSTLKSMPSWVCEKSAEGLDTEVYTYVNRPKLHMLTLKGKTSLHKSTCMHVSRGDQVFTKQKIPTITGFKTHCCVKVTGWWSQVTPCKSHGNDVILSNTHTHSDIHTSSSYTV